MRFKGGRRELTIRNGSAVLRTNGESFDATDILKDMRAHGVGHRQGIRKGHERDVER